MGDRKKDGITFSSKIIRCLAVLDNLKKKKRKLQKQRLRCKWNEKYLNFDALEFQIYRIIFTHSSAINTNIAKRPSLASNVEKRNQISSLSRPLLLKSFKKEGKNRDIKEILQQRCDIIDLWRKREWVSYGFSWKKLDSIVP